MPYAIALAAGHFGVKCSIIAVYGDWADAIRHRNRSERYAIYECGPGAAPGDELWGDMMPPRADRTPHGMPPCKIDGDGRFVWVWSIDPIIHDRIGHRARWDRDGIRVAGPFATRIAAEAGERRWRKEWLAMPPWTDRLAPLSLVRELT